MTQFYLVLLLLLFPFAPDIPDAHLISDFALHREAWNNCSPATLTMGLSHFGYTADQFHAANWLKPNSEDRSVNPRQMMTFVNTQLTDLPVRALVRHGGTLPLLQMLIANDFPIILEIGFEPAGEGWMGHYILLKGYDATGFLTNDSYKGTEELYLYPHLQEVWSHFNYTYLILYDPAREAELLTLLGADADEHQNIVRALSLSYGQMLSDPGDAFAWFNIGTNFVYLGYMEAAAIAYDRAFAIRLPARMMWYQYGPFEAYNAVGRYQDAIMLAQRNLNDGGGQFVEETFYYAGIAREHLGETQRAINNYREAVNFNPNFDLAREALNRLTQE